MEKRKKTVIIILLLSIIGFSGLFFWRYGVSYAKYVYNSVIDYYLKSKDFYFNSDYLGLDVIENVDNLWDGNSVYFNIRNNLNESVATSSDINYRIDCEIEGEEAAYLDCHLNNTTSNTFDGTLSSFQICVNLKDDEDVSGYNKTDCEMGGYKWSNEKSSSDLHFDIIVKDESYQIEDVIVLIKATSTTPYQKILQGRFILHKATLEEGELKLDYKNYSNYDRLIISNSYLTDKCISINWDSTKVIIANDKSEFSSYDVDDNGYINKIMINVEAQKALNYIFYRKDSTNNYDKSGFTLNEYVGC